MIYLLDTNAVRDVMDERTATAARVAATSQLSRVVACSVVYGEVLYGIERLATGKRRTELEEKAHKVFASLSLDAVPVEAGAHYAQIKVMRQRAGRPMEENDLWIAATALALGATLVTRDTDFRQVAGLIVEDWSN